MHQQQGCDWEDEDSDCKSDHSRRERATGCGALETRGGYCERKKEQREVVRLKVIAEEHRDGERCAKARAGGSALADGPEEDQR